jgi:membrane protein implicated in regulation of membrane protease activity
MPQGTPSPRALALARQSRLASLVIAGAMVLWLGGQAAGAYFGWEARFAILFDLAALAALIFALVVTFRVWRARRET